MVSAPRSHVSRRPRAPWMRLVKTWPRSRSAASWTSSTARKSTLRSSGIASTVHIQKDGFGGTMRSSPVTRATDPAPRNAATRS